MDEYEYEAFEEEMAKRDAMFFFSDKDKLSSFGYGLDDDY